jgi:hypothetical protein
MPSYVLGPVVHHSLSLAVGVYAAQSGCEILIISPFHFTFHILVGAWHELVFHFNNQKGRDDLLNFNEKSEFCILCGLVVFLFICVRSGL